MTQSVSRVVRRIISVTAVCGFLAATSFAADDTTPQASSPSEVQELKKQLADQQKQIEELRLILLGQKKQIESVSNAAGRARGTSARANARL